MSATAPPPPAPPAGPARRRRARLEDPATTAPLFDHLGELRLRLTIIALVLLGAFSLCYWQQDRVFHLLARPLDDRWPLQTFGVTEPFFTSLSVAAQAAFVLTTPVLTWHAWRFVRPAIAPDARRAVGVLLLVAPLLFTTGVVFGYVFVLGPAVQVLLGLGPDSIDVVVRASDYYSFVSTTLLAIGGAFLFPLALLGVARIGLLTAERLASSRKIAIVLIVVLAALLPTADPVSLAIEVLPLALLYELSIVAVRLQERVLAKRARAGGAGDGAA